MEQRDNKLKKNIWLINHYAGNTFFDKGGRHYSFAKYLKKAGYNPTVFCSNSKHGIQECFFLDDSLWHEHIEEEINVPFVFVKSRTYAGNGRQRILNMIDFYRNIKRAAKQLAEKNGKPDALFASSVHPLTLLAGIKLARRFGIKCICEVRDLWPESIVDFGGVSKHNIVIIMLRLLEKWLYTKADSLIFTMEGGVDYIIEQKWDLAHGGSVDLKKICYINNGVDLSVFDSNKEKYRIEDEDLNKEEQFNFVYAGALRKANNVGQLLDVAKAVRNPKIKFLIWGDGEDLQNLKKRIEDEHIVNVVLKGKVEKKYVAYIDSCAYSNILNYEMHDIWRFGGSQNKIFEYFAAGKPVLTNLTMGYDLINRYNCGVHVDYSNIKDVARIIDDFTDMDAKSYLKMCQNARRAAVDYDFSNLTQKLIGLVENKKEGA